MIQVFGASLLDPFLQQRAFCDGAGSTITGLIAEACGRAVDLQTRTGALSSSGRETGRWIPFRFGWSGGSAL